MLGPGGCARPQARPAPAPVADAPYELEDDLDLAEHVEWLHGLPPGPARTALRVGAAGALVDRIAELLAAGRNDRVDQTVGELALLWTEEPAAMAAELAPHVAVLRRARAAFARAGNDREVALVLALLANAEPARRAEHTAELLEVLAYADDLTRARLGPLGVGSGTILALEPIVHRRLLPELTDRHVGLLVDRANLADTAVTGALAAGKPVPDSNAIRMAFHAARDLAITLAFAHRGHELAGALVRLNGIGKIRGLGAAAVAVARPTASARDWVALARAIRDDRDGPERDDDEALAGAALAICLDALVRFPDDATLLAAAGGHAADLGRVHQPIALYERARARAKADPELADRLAGLYRERMARLVFGARPRAARAGLDELRRFYDRVEAEFPGRRWTSTWAEALATYGRGLVSQGSLRDARTELDRSIKFEPTVAAYEMLGTVALKLGDHAAARRHLDRGAALGGDTPDELYARAKILRLAGDAARGAGDADAATERWLKALEIWNDLGDKVDLPPTLAGERLVEAGKLFWSLGHRDKGLELLEGALETDPGGADTHVHVVAFLLLHDELDRATDAVYAALASDGISEYYKVYLSLWLIVEARRAGRPDDRQAAAYLASRDGPLWYDDVARLATGRATADTLHARANTRSRRAELIYYTAVLGGPSRSPDEVRRSLEDVVATEMVLFFEYDMARHWLGQAP